MTDVKNVYLDKFPCFVFLFSCAFLKIDEQIANVLGGDNKWDLKVY